MFASNSTPCADTDGNACTTAGCNGQGVCDQGHSTKVCAAADECNGGCDTTSGQSTPKTSTPCTDTDGNVCTIAGCEAGVCVQTHMSASDSTPCPDSDGNACTTAGCNGAGVCDQNHMTQPCPGPDECNGGCDPTTGQSTPKTSTPCTDTDGNVCTIAGCEAGVCVQTHMSASDSTPCPDSDGNACTTAGCNGAGVCDQNHMTQPCPGPDECNGGCDPTTGQCTPKTSTPCTDTDGNVCTIAGCEAGVCVQTHMSASDSTPCPDTDNDACTTAGCNGQGVCDQNHMHCVQGCFTRTPGFWATHPAITQAVLGAGLPSCGLVVDTTAAATPVSSTEDMCSVGTDSKANHTSSQQVQLIRQCMSAALNLAATAQAPTPGDCNSVSPGISSQFDTCCTGPTSVCDS